MKRTQTVIYIYLGALHLSIVISWIEIILSLQWTTKHFSPC